MLEYLVIAVAVTLTPTGAWPDEYIVPNDTVQCANDLINWCDGMKYPQEGAGMSMISITVSEPDGFYRYLCVSDSDGTNCTQNGSPWFCCTSDNKFYYKGNQLSGNSTEGTDDNLCKTADRAFNDLLVQNLSYDNTTLKAEVQKGMESFFREMANMQEQIEKIMHLMNFDNLFGNSFFTGGKRDVGVPVPTTDSNQIERE